MLISVIPELSTQEELSSLLHRIAFYFGHREVGRVTVGVRQSSAPTVGACELPDGFDRLAAERFSRIAPSVELTSDSAVLGARLEVSDVVLLWDGDRLASEYWDQAMEFVPSRAAVFGVDLRRDRMEGSHYTSAEFASSPRVGDLTDLSRRRFDSLVNRIGGAERAYLLATGPSIDHFGAHDFGDGVVIACNTTVLDDELMDHTGPDIVTFADPIFHFGCSTYAAEFRRELRRQAERHDFDVVIPLKYFELFTSICPELEPRTIGIPFDGKRPNLDLDSDFSVAPIDNIATLLMLPLACTVAREVALLGFDGRSRDESYFWRHSRRAQLHDLLPVIKGVHPSFFDTDYDDYYDRHSSNLERYLTAGEQLGHSFRSLEETYIPALRRRSVEFDEPTYIKALAPNARYRLVSLNPDLEDTFGHYRLYDESLRKAAAGDGGDVVTLANTAYESQDSWIVPAFTDNSWSVRRDQPQVHIERFRHEFERIYETVSKHAGEVPTGIFMYVGSERHVVEVADIVAGIGPQIPVLINLFHSHHDLFEVEEGVASPAVGMGLMLTRSLRERAGIHVLADSEGLARRVARHFGEDLSIWPMFSVRPIEAPLENRARVHDRARGPLTVYAPGNVQFSKGYDLVSKLSERLARNPGSRDIKLVARSYFRHGTDRRLRRYAERLSEHATVLEGLLSDEEYADAFRDADVILIPYRASHFGTRTSAVISDAVSIGKPVVATHGTWVGDIVEKYDLGATFADGDVADFEKALWRVVRHVDYYRGRASVASLEWEDEHNPRLLVDVLRGVVEEWKPDMATLDHGVNTQDIRATFAHLTRFEVGTPSTDRAYRRAREDLVSARDQLRNVKESAAFRLATKVVDLLKKLGPLYRPLRSFARRIAGRS